MIKTNPTGLLATVADEELAKYRGQWIAYRAENAQVVAGCESLDELRRRVLDAGEDANEVMLMRVPAESEDPSLGGLEFQ